MSSEQPASITDQDVKDLMGSLKTLRQTLPAGQQSALDALVHRALSDDEVTGHNFGYNFSSFNQGGYPGFEAGFEAGDSDFTFPSGERQGW